jgi:hypothetical protein
MGTVDVCGDGVLLYVLCLGFPCYVLNSIQIICFLQLMRLLDMCCCIEYDVNEFHEIKCFFALNDLYHVCLEG